MKLTVGVDIGGTKIAAGVVDDAGRVLARLQRPTPARTAEVAEAVAVLIEGLCEDYPVAAVGLGVGGFIDAERETVLFAKNIGWRSEPIRRTMESRLGLPVVIENDANAAAWAESRFGAGSGEAFLVVLTVGTGVGCGIIIGGSIYRGSFGTAAECGHLPLVPGGLRCSCGGDGCWEMYCSGTALETEARKLAQQGSADSLLRRAGGRIEAITGGVVTAAAAEGDTVAVGLMRETAWWLGRGMAAIAAVLDPGCFVIAGGLSVAESLLIDAARESFLSHLPARGMRGEARIVAAGLGLDAGLIGAADLARARASR